MTWKGIEAQRVKRPTPSRATDALIGEEENKKGKQEKEKQTETENGFPTQLPWIIQSPPTTHRDHTVSLFVVHPLRELDFSE